MQNGLYAQMDIKRFAPVAAWRNRPRSGRSFSIHGADERLDAATSGLLATTNGCSTDRPLIDGKSLSSRNISTGYGPYIHNS
ncbi:MAG: hypothetical protein RLY14_2582, partial [Planctomycetota bacterium]